MTDCPTGSTMLQEQYEGESVPDTGLFMSLRMSLSVLISLWIIVIWIVNPVGEFMVNDDWAFISALERLVFEGRMGSTGWGPGDAPGGPALIAHLSWGRLFTYLFGHSITNLRISVLVMGILGSVILLVLLRSSGASPRMSLWGVLTLVFCPLFLPLCFSFMTDATFLSLAVFSVLLLHIGVENKKCALVVFGLLAALGSILIRQIGIVIPAGFVIACRLHPKGKELGNWKMLILAVCVAVIPWLLYECTLFLIGSTPITEHQVVKNVSSQFHLKGLLGFVNLMGYRTVFALLYWGFLVSPVVALRYREFLQFRSFRYFGIALAGGTVLFEIALILGIVHPPVFFWPNTITDFGVGPVLLKDTYLLDIKRGITIPATLYYLLVSWSVLSLAGSLILTISAFTRIGRLFGAKGTVEISFLTVFILAAGWLYLGIILLTGFHDRYLLFLCMVGIVWVLSDAPRTDGLFFQPLKLAPSWIPLLAIAVFTVLSLHDFMELKRAQSMALDYLVKEKKVDPCHVDGGFEFNGYHCDGKPFRRQSGLSWWWVHQEDFVVTLGPLPGYRVVRTYPFNRYMGRDGAIHVLQPASQ